MDKVRIVTVRVVGYLKTWTPGMEASVEVTRSGHSVESVVRKVRDDLRCEYGEDLRCCTFWTVDEA